MPRTAKLLMVTEDNHNKFYNMFDDGSKLLVEWGRVGATCQTTEYPSHKWDSLYKSKTKKGYKDVTELFTVAPTSSKVDFIDIQDRMIAELIHKLESYTKKTVSNNYNVTADSVTQKQIDEAQCLLNALLSVKNNKQVNQTLLDLFAVIPRKMKKVSDHLFNEQGDFDFSQVQKVVFTEQELLDTMSQQVSQSILVKENIDDKKTILDAMGINIFNIRPDQETMIKNKLGSISDKFVRAFRVENIKTQKRFDEYVAKKDNKKTELFWHGTRNSSVLPIMQQGLLIRPTNGTYTGSMFSDGIYGANKAIKSYGYTDGRGSYWAKGNSNDAFMFLFTFHVGRQYIIDKWQPWMQKIDKDSRFEGYDSVYAKGGADLKNDEFVVYNPSAVTCKYLVNLQG